MGPWWIFSLLLHLALVGALFYTLPAPTRFIPSNEAPALSAASPEKIAQVAGDIRARESEALRARVEELQRLGEEMAGLQKEAFERLNELNKKNAEEARQRLADAQNRAVLAQEEALRKLAEKDLPAAKASQDRATQAQNEALKALEAPGIPADAEARTAQQDALHAQKEATAALDAANQAAQQPPGNPAGNTAQNSQSTPATTPASPDPAALQAAQEKSRTAQAAALDSQKRARDKSTAAPNARPITPTYPEKSDIASAKTIPELYNTARRIEDALTASYQDARAAELAALQHLPIGEARKLTQTTRPERPNLDEEALTGSVTQAAGLQKQEEQILTARKEVAGMLAQANNILGQVRQPGDGAGVTVESLRARGSHAREMENAALANEGTPARDLTGLMARGGKGAGAGGEILPGPGVGPAGSFTSPPKLPPRQFQAVPGRRLVSAPAPVEKGKDGSWMFLDSWYLIGPWPNEDRRNLNTKFPPESIINLDAVYQNEEGNKLRWRFYQSGNEMIQPPGLGEYQIYYAFTELWSESECDRWIAVGSDDQSKVWVNDELVWKSSDILKGWNPGEGLRKIHLNQGNNRILVRLENGHLSGGFSIIVKMEN